MFQQILTKVLGSKQDRDLKRFQPIINAVNQREAETKRLTDSQLQSKTTHFREKFHAGEPLDNLLPDAFAVVREAAVRTLGQRHYDVQIMGGAALHQGCIAEMKTGEGKTLTSTLAVYLNALTGNGVHVATVNDYLARRDAEWMGKIYNFLGLSVGLTISMMPHEQKKLGYKADITYGVHSEFGFDYLWDNKASYLDAKVQRGHHYAILDEVDSILIDEARVPLIISEPYGEPVELYTKINRAVVRLKAAAHYEIDEKSSKRGSVALTEDGVEEMQRLIGVTDLYDHTNMELVHHVNQSLIAQHLYQRDVDYLVEQGEVILVDEFTGRKQPGRRLSEGLHQAIEAKERVRIVQESQTGASITYQNFFRMYGKLAGMTGTAETEAAEFGHIYKLDVVVVPTNEPMIREDHSDQIYKTEESKYRAIIDDIVEQHEKKRPVLVGTISIEKSEKLSKLLKAKQRDVRHQVLNAKEHAREAEIISQAGTPGAVTIATNMAGRGVDILLGGNPDGMVKEILRKRNGDADAIDEDSGEWRTAYAEAEAACEENREAVLQAGGLHIIGTERHDSRRIDNQLRGRSGRQGDIGSSRFYLSLEDDLMRKFGSDRLSGMMDRVGMEEDIPIEHPWVTKAIEKAQTRVEERHFEIRKNVLKFDDVMNTQRQTVYDLRNSILEGENLKTTIWAMIENVLDDRLQVDVPIEGTEEELESITKWLAQTFPVDLRAWGSPMTEMNLPQLREKTIEALRTTYEKREEDMGAEQMRTLERLLLLDRIDSHWKDHLYNIDYIEEGIHLRSYGGKDPIVVFKNEAFNVFEAMYQRIEEETSEYIFKVHLDVEAPRRTVPQRRSPQSGVPRRRRSMASSSREEDISSSAEFASREAMGSIPKVGRNEPCPCGSGRKFKRCHGK
ncbi:MAG: preprotein translocase subunit SecA [Candidatus Poribacteria bacterium]|nr:preprotein translocase subunit SecA [Candidatus Poribacteria bacterium]MDE0502799.1 preprotein translocase subunit SecA [Candidatus Poribacteria bacterium]